jgi:hypothetical protein
MKAFKEFAIYTLLPWALGVMLGGAFVVWLFIGYSPAP